MFSADDDHFIDLLGKMAEEAEAFLISVVDWSQEEAPSRGLCHQQNVSIEMVQLCAGLMRIMHCHHGVQHDED